MLAGGEIRTAGEKNTGARRGKVYKNGKDCDHEPHRRRTGPGLLRRRGTGERVLRAPRPAEEAACPGIPGHLRSAAEAGDAEAQAELGAILIEGRCGAPESARRDGIGWLARASAQGHADAAALLGDLLLAEGSAGKDEALTQYRRAAAGGHVTAQHRLGILLVAAGNRDAREEGLYWLGAASSGGDGMAAVAVGLLHARGLHGVPHDACLAAAWYEAGRLIGAPVPIAELEAELGAEAPQLCNARAP